MPLTSISIDLSSHLSKYCLSASETSWPSRILSDIRNKPTASAPCTIPPAGRICDQSIKSPTSPMPIGLFSHISTVCLGNLDRASSTVLFRSSSRCSIRGKPFSSVLSNVIALLIEASFCCITLGPISSKNISPVSSGTSIAMRSSVSTLCIKRATASFIT